MNSINLEDSVELKFLTRSGYSTGGAIVGGLVRAGAAVTAALVDRDAVFDDPIASITESVPETLAQGRVINGARDPLTTPEHATACAAALGCPLDLLPDVGHALIPEAPQQIADALAALT